MIILIVSVTCLYIILAASIDLSPGKPVPHADVIHGILTTYINNNSDTKDSLLRYLFNSTGTENLDLNILDAQNLKKIVEMAKKKYELQHEAEFRRAKKGSEALNTSHAHLMDMAMKQMQQSIYATKYRIQDTRPYRKRFRDEGSYNIAILVGSLNVIVTKMQNLCHQMYELPYKTHFLWYLIIYEKVVACHVDVTYMVKRIFALHEVHVSKLSSD